MNNNFPLSTLLISIIASSFLVGCGKDDSNKQTIVTQQAIQKYDKETILTGRISNKKGNIKIGTVTASNNKTKLISTSQINKDGDYSLSVPAGTELPIILTYTSPDNQDDDKLISVAIYSVLKKYDINDLTTLIAKQAKSLGGYTRSNMSIAADSTVGVPDANKTSTGFRGDPTSQYGGWH